MTFYITIYKRIDELALDNKRDLRYIEDMIYLYIALGVLGLLLLCLAALLLVCYFLPFYQRPHKKEDHYRLPDSPHFNTNRDKMYALIAEMEAVPFERVYTESFDGLRLSARYYHVADGAPLQIQIPGYRGTSVRDFCGGNKLARKCGFNTLLIDLRAHGKSKGRTITFGAKEKRDAASWIDYAVKRFGADTEIWLVGVSMGASTALLASGLPLPANVKGVIADCPYAKGEDIIADSCRKKHLNPKFMLPFIKASAKIFGRFDLKDANVLQAVSQTNLPILLIHGEADDIVPCEMSRLIAENCRGYVERHTFPQAGHGLSYMADNRRYEQIIVDFIAKVRAENK